MGRVPQVANYLIDVVFELLNLAARLNCNRPCEVPLGNRGGNVGDGTHLSGQVGGQLIDVVGQVFPGAGGTRHVRLAAQSAFHAHLPGHGSDLIGKDGEGINQVVDGVSDLYNLAADVHGDLLREVAIRDRGGHLGYVSDLIGQIPRHGIDVVGQVLPGTGYALHLRLAAQLAVGADLARHARHLRCKSAELIHHGVDGVLQLQDLALDVHGDLFREVTGGEACGDLG